MQCTAQYSRDSKASPVVFNNKSAFTFIEILICLLIVSCLLMTVVPVANKISLDFSYLVEPLLVSSIRNKILHISAECICRLKEGKIVYNKGQKLNGYVFLNELLLEFTYYGQIHKGASANLQKNDKLYQLSVRPVTGIVNLKAIVVK